MRKALRVILGIAALFVGGCSHTVSLNDEDNEEVGEDVDEDVGEDVDDKVSSSDTQKSSSSSQKELKDAWSWDVSRASLLNPKITYGTMTDSRDGKKYKTIKIGSQTWMAENLNFADSAANPSLKGRSWCYDDKAENCAVTGRLYTWAAAIDSVKLATDADNPQDCGYGKTCTLPASVQGICPKGWHLPKEADWNTLFSAVGGKSAAGSALKSQTGWYGSGDGADGYGFSALPAGLRDLNGNFYDVGNSAYVWSASWFGSHEAAYMNLYYGRKSALQDYDYSYVGFSVRCLQNSDDTAKSSSSSSLNGDESSSSSVKSSSSAVPSWDLPKDEYLNSEISYESITDDRDGKTYKVVKIGEQWWMAENLNYADSVATPSLKGGSWCYNDLEENCEVAGRLYTWTAAIDSVKLATDADNPRDCGRYHDCGYLGRIQGICPDGWYLPRDGDWETLFEAVGGKLEQTGNYANAGKALKSQLGWSNKGGGTDAYGFAALPTGRRNGSGFESIGSRASYWTATQSSTVQADYEGLVSASNDAFSFYSEFIEVAFSVRCFKDAD